MAKVSFVGFQEKIEIPEGFQELEIEETFQSEKNKDALFSLISNPQFISQWLYEVHSFNSRPGGKLVFTNGTEATCTSFLLGKEVSLISDSFGNFTAKVAKGKPLNSLHLRFSLLTDNPQGKSEEILLLLESLGALI